MSEPYQAPPPWWAQTVSDLDTLLAQWPCPHYLIMGEPYQKCPRKQCN